MSEEVLIPLVVFGAIVVVVKIISDTMTRHRLIAKGMADEKVKHLFVKDAQLQWLSSLKWGLILVGVGLALLLRQIAPFYVSDESIFGVMFIFAGIAFFIYYGIARKHLNRTGEPR